MGKKSDSMHHKWKQRNSTQQEVAIKIIEKTNCDDRELLTYEGRNRSPLQIQSCKSVLVEDVYSTKSR